ncbi:pyridoxal phosphate-dependent class II aminotransferase [Candidatus Bacteroides intestinigallinarum]|jgi:putative histidinol-phosphate transaminase|uniref:threonine-phosphate decarboxylase n=1 Tax=Bacteroides TaxID=816 RepID=UPI000E80E5F0|nr:MULTISPECIES: threonine-phosphate decarboxylase [Bacteroides]MCS3179749.1 pyridoxal phosphate-dependent class II aminotransferase [Candidatus Bacteroides intestinigallinarum]RGN60348.1 pyridoxal phosphate-dependent class II aminotransferase [Bacteroides sp. OM05-10AA]RGQ65864.1 pyridoxal phosphate-dependent class II aminotransferase [Bacteroides sp. AF27-33]
MIEGHGDDLYKYGKKIVSNFSSNVYNRIDHSGLYQRLNERLSTICSYPEPMPYSLESEIARRYSLTPRQVCVTNGATEAIYLIAQVFQGRISAVLGPTFSEYADACRVHRHKVKPFYSLDALPEDAELVWICNPNNPTGEVRNKEDLKALVDSHPDKLFIFDQSYEYFTLKSLLGIKEAASFPNVILLHSMTKQYAIPGLRVGYFTASEGLTDDVRCRRMPWSVNSLAIEAAKYLLEEGDGISADFPQLLAERERLTNLLLATGMLEIWPTDTHYMLIKLRMGKAAALKDFLAVNHGILIRDASNFEGLDERFFRIATQTPEENDKLVKAISEWMEQIMS